MSGLKELIKKVKGVDITLKILDLDMSLSHAAPKVPNVLTQGYYLGAKRGNGRALRCRLLLIAIFEETGRLPYNGRFPEPLDPKGSR